MRVCEANERVCIGGQRAHVWPQPGAPSPLPSQAPVAPVPPATGRKRSHGSTSLQLNAASSPHAAATSRRAAAAAHRSPDLDPQEVAAPALRHARAGARGALRRAALQQQQEAARAAA